MFEVNDILYINKVVADRFGGSSGLRDRGLLESAIARYENTKMYGEGNPTMAMVEGIIRNHPFVDGNKRTALVVLFSTLALNNETAYVDGVSLAAMIDGLASRKVDPGYIATYLDENTYEYMWRGIEHLIDNNEGLEKALDVLARKDADELTEEEKAYFS